MLTRKGETGDWCDSREFRHVLPALFWPHAFRPVRRNHFTVNQNAEFEQQWKDITKGSELCAGIIEDRQA